ncbi:DUF1131 family protein, partial [Salmonella enterica subsp. enterica serovar Montevideo]|nr:DUF1131 family protein [Salmonella enterica subsp. enterica serovar Montevideo]
DNGNVVRFFEAMKGDNVAMVINGEQGTVSRIDVLDSDIPTAAVQPFNLVICGKSFTVFTFFPIHSPAKPPDRQIHHNPFPLRHA